MTRGDILPTEAEAENKTVKTVTFLKQNIVLLNDHVTGSSEVGGGGMPSFGSSAVALQPRQRAVSG